MDLLELYKSVLASVDMTVDKEGLVSIIIEGERDPIFINKQRLVLPTREILREGLGDQRVAFHPVEENFMAKSESPVLKTFRKVATMKLTGNIIRLMVQLMKLAVDADRHSSLNPKQSEFLSHVPDVTKKTMATLEKLVKKINPATNHDLINLYIRMGGELKGTKYHRLGVVSFPLLSEFDGEVEAIYGVKPQRKLDFPMIEGLLLYIFPGGKDTTTYSYGSNDQTAPAFDALLHAYLNVANRFNHVVKTFKGVIEDGELTDYRELLLDTSWEDAIADLSQYKGHIPPLEGNINDSAPVAASPSETPQPAAVKEGQPVDFNYAPRAPQPAAQPAPVAAQPGQQYANLVPPVESAGSDGVDFASLKAHNVSVVTGGAAARPTAAPVPVAAAPMPGYGYAPMPGYPAMPGAPMPGAPMPGYPAPGMVMPGAPMMPGMMGGGMPEWMGANVPGVASPAMTMPGVMPGMVPMNPAMAPRVSTAARYAMTGVYNAPPGYNAGMGMPVNPGMPYGGYNPGAPVPATMPYGSGTLVNGPYRY